MEEFFENFCSCCTLKTAGLTFAVIHVLYGLCMCGFSVFTALSTEQLETFEYAFAIYYGALCIAAILFIVGLKNKKHGLMFLLVILVGLNLNIPLMSMILTKCTDKKHMLDNSGFFWGLGWAILSAGFSLWIFIIFFGNYLLVKCGMR